MLSGEGKKWVIPRKIEESPSQSAVILFYRLRFLQATRVPLRRTRCLAGGVEVLANEYLLRGFIQFGRSLFPPGGWVGAVGFGKEKCKEP
jgi:hypothetical protein